MLRRYLFLCSRKEYVKALNQALLCFALLPLAAALNTCANTPICPPHLPAGSALAWQARLSQPQRQIAQGLPVARHQNQDHCARFCSPSLTPDVFHSTRYALPSFIDCVVQRLRLKGGPVKVFQGWRRW